MLDISHDRAVFHLLLDPEARARYVAAARPALKLGGYIVVATFGPMGPQQCSGLEVVRCSAEQLHGQFDRSFQEIASFEELHQSPDGTDQEFVYCYCKLSA